MIDAELAGRATRLLSTMVGELVEDEHVTLVTVPALGAEPAQAARLAELGRDVTALALALEVILRRAGDAPGGADA